MKHSGRSSGVRRGMLLLVVIGAWLAIAAVGGPALGKLSQVTTNDQATFLPRSAESVLAQQQFQRVAGTEALPVFVVLEGEQVYADYLVSLSAGAAPGAAYGASIAQELTIAEEQFSAALADGRPTIAIPANDESGVLLLYSLNSATVTEQTADSEDLLGVIVEDLRERTLELPGVDASYVGGPAGFAADTSQAFAGIDGTLLIVTLSVVLFILLIVYRSLVLPVFVLFSSVCGLALAGYVVYRLADADILVLNGQSQGILSILVIGAGTDYSLLLVARYREELERVDSRRRAMRIAWRASVEPIAASAGTVIVGLLCLLLSDLNSNRGLGPVGAIGIAAAFIVSLTLLPALLLLGRWVFWPRVPRASADRAGAGAGDEAGARDDAEAAPTGIWARVAEAVARRPRAIWMGVSAVLLAFCAAVPTFQASGTPESDIFLSDVDAVLTQQVIDQKYDAGAADTLFVIYDTAEGGDPKDLSNELLEVTGLDTAEATEMGGSTIITVSPAEGTSAAEIVSEVRSVAHAAEPDSLVGGDAALKLDTQLTAESDLKVIIPVILAVILVILIALLRSITAPLILVAATVVSFGAAIGVAALLFNNVWDFPGSDPAVPLLGFVFLVALGVDYSIFLMTRAREEVARSGSIEGVTRALRVTGGVITSAGIVLAATFAALAVIPLLFMAQIAFIVAFGVLLDTLIVRSLLVPAIAIDLGRRTWWPSHLSRDPAKGVAAPAADR